MESNLKAGPQEAEVDLLLLEPGSRGTIQKERERKRQRQRQKRRERKREEKKKNREKK